MTCGTCGSSVYVLRWVGGAEWTMQCENGHYWWPTPGTEIEISFDFAGCAWRWTETEALEQERRGEE